MKSRVLAITVTYQPDITTLFEQFDILTSSHVDILVVDNNSVNIGEIAERLTTYRPTIELFSFNENVGIASAQNHGIEIAITRKYDYILLMDQDSIPENNMVSELLTAVKKYPEAAAIGPNFIDNEHRSRARFIRVEQLSIVKMSEHDSENIVEVDHVIASGSLLPVRHLPVIGMMDGSLFIDYVDIEWALRARSEGYRSYGCFSAKMHHALGDDHINVFGRHVAVHTPLRHYYMVRNALLLYKRSYIPISWKLIDAIKLISKISILILFSESKKKNISAVIRGLYHGIINRSGKYTPK
ncbi:glycosyltransferase family 2 protein [Pantoea sp. BAV 3049]|uniref:glycosyltransferase family 2 protein n=1 Tax=Pantoea sp. BAV 3049 TaxID=2654188 RepID=UPI00131B5E84|nr:glycosyltransferase family 2 protein [Pantoea sp. BAV 3049]